MQDPALKWSKRLESGIKSLDLQHKAYLAHANKFSSLCSAGKPVEALLKNFSFLSAYASDHFAYEESLMAFAKFPMAPSHIKTHEEFKKKLQSLRDKIGRYQYGHDAVLSSNIMLIDWFIRHIQKADAIFCRFVSERLVSDARFKELLEEFESSRHAKGSGGKNASRRRAGA